MQRLEYLSIAVDRTEPAHSKKPRFITKTNDERNIRWNWNSSGCNGNVDWTNFISTTGQMSTHLSQAMWSKGFIAISNNWDRMLLLLKYLHEVRYCGREPGIAWSAGLSSHWSCGEYSTKLKIDKIKVWFWQFGHNRRDIYQTSYKSSDAPFEMTLTGCPTFMTRCLLATMITY